MIERLTKKLLIYFTFLAWSDCEVLQGPGENARIIPNSENIPADELPVEHRGESVLLLPDVFSVSRNVTTLLDVDLFFSLFFVFLNNQFDESGTEFTIFAPAGLPTSEATKWLSAEEKLTEELLLNHIVLGEHLRPELIPSMGGAVRTTLGGLDVSFKIDKEGELWINDVRIVAWRTEGKALIIALEDYLFKQEVEQEVKNLVTNEIDDDKEEEWGEERGDVEIDAPVAKTEEFVPTPRNQDKKCTKVENKSGLTIFKTITVCTENVSVNESTKSPEVRKVDTNTPILEMLETELSYLRGGPGLNYFLTYANETNMTEIFNPKKSYTILAPVDEAFQSWHPIDWGFNPFLVTEFLQELMENLIIENKIDLEEEDKDTKFVTMGGKDVHIKHKGENIYLNDILVIGDLVLPGSESEIIFLASVPWMNLTIVEELRKNYSHLETGPPAFDGSIYDLEDYTTEDESVDEVTEEISTTDAFQDQSYFFVNFPDNEEIVVKNNFEDENNSVNFPKIKDDIEEVLTTDSSIQFYNKTEDNNAEVIVQRLKQFLQKEKNKEFSDENNVQPRQTKVVYINNKRVELETDVSA